MEINLHGKRAFVSDVSSRGCGFEQVDLHQALSIPLPAEPGSALVTSECDRIMLCRQDVSQQKVIIFLV